MKFGAGVWPFQWQPPYDDAVQRIANLGFRATELIAWNRDFLNDYYTPSKVMDLRKVLDGEGIEISQFVSTPHDLSNSDASKRKAAVQHFLRAIEVRVEL